MATTGETVAAMSAGDVAFADDEITFGKAFHVIADKIDNPHKLVANGHRDGDRFLGPGIPVIYMYVGAADRRLDDADEHVVAGDLGNRDLLEPQARSRLRFR